MSKRRWKQSTSEQGKKEKHRKCSILCKVLLTIPHMLEKRNEGLTMNIFSRVEVKFLAIIYTILVIIFVENKQKMNEIPNAA